MKNRTEINVKMYKNMDSISDINDQKEFDNLAIPKEDLGGKEFSSCLFKKCDFSECTFQGSSFSECKFTDCNLSNAKIQNCGFKKVVFRNCKLLGIIMADVNHFLLDWSFEKCKIELCNFGGLKMKKSRFYECAIKDSDFIDAQLSEADFSLSDLQGCVFRNTNLEGANFSGAKHYYNDPAQNKLKKAKFSMPEAMGLLVPFGIEIE